MDRGNQQHVRLPKLKEPWYKSFWLWIVVIIVGLAVASSLQGSTGGDVTPGKQDTASSSR